MESIKLNILWPNVLFTNIYLIPNREADESHFKLIFNITFLHLKFKYGRYKLGRFINHVTSEAHLNSKSSTVFTCCMISEVDSKQELGLYLFFMFSSRR